MQQLEHLNGAPKVYRLCTVNEDFYTQYGKHIKCATDMNIWYTQNVSTEHSKNTSTKLVLVYTELHKLLFRAVPECSSTENTTELKMRGLYWSVPLTIHSLTTNLLACFSVIWQCRLARINACVPNSRRKLIDKYIRVWIYSGYISVMSEYISVDSEIHLSHRKV